MYQEIHSLVSLALPKNDVYQNLLSGLSRNALSLLQNKNISKETVSLIQQEVFDIAVLLAHSSVLDVMSSFLSFSATKSSVLEYCRFFYDFMVNVPTSAYPMKAFGDLWMQFVSFLQTTFNKWKDCPQSDSFCVYLLRKEPPENQLLLLQYFSTLARFAVTVLSYLLSINQRVNSYIYALCYLIVLCSSTLLESLNKRIIQINDIFDYGMMYTSLLQVTNTFHQFIVTQSAICADSNGAYLLLQLFLLVSSPFSISGENLIAIYQCLRCLFNISVFLFL